MTTYDTYQWPIRSLIQSTFISSIYIPKCLLLHLFLLFILLLLIYCKYLLKRLHLQESNSLLSQYRCLMHISTSNQTKTPETNANPNEPLEKSISLSKVNRKTIGKFIGRSRVFCDLLKDFSRIKYKQLRN